MSRETSADLEGRNGGVGGGGGVEPEARVGSRANTGAEEIGPGQTYMPFVVMEVSLVHQKSQC